jgi:hypothetical protein
LTGKQNKKREKKKKKVNLLLLQNEQDLQRSYRTTEFPLRLTEWLKPLERMIKGSREEQKNE